MTRFLLRLFNLHKVDFGSAAGWTLRFTTEWAPPVILFGCIGLVLLVWRVYRREKGTATPGAKLVLGLLRLFALAVLVFVLLQPVLVVQRSELKESVVIVLADRSDSMKLEDKYRDRGNQALLARLAYATGLSESLTPDRPVAREVADRLRAMSRAEIANRVLGNPRINVIDRMARHSRVRQFVFASGVSPAPTAEAAAPSGGDGAPAVRPLVIVPDGPTTQIGECIRDALAELRGQRVAAMVILSDWNSNSGTPPVEAARRYAREAKASFPIFAVGVGDPAEQRDIVVAGVSANRVAFLNDPLVFNVAIEQVGCAGRTVPLELRVGDGVVATKEITLEAERKYYTITHRPAAKGVFKYVIRVPEQADELSGHNNSVEHTVTVKDDKVRVLLVSAVPTWEWRFLKSALARDKTVEVGVWLQAAGAKWVMAGGRQLSQMPLNKKELVDQYDAIILLGASPDAFSDEQLENIRSFVGDFGGGLIFAAGAGVQTEGFGKSPLAKCLPVELAPPAGFSPATGSGHSFKPRLTPEGWAHPAMELAEDAHQNREIWEALPGLFWFHPAGKVKPGARVLAEHPEEKTERGAFPIFVEQRYGFGRVLFSASDETWRWRFLIGDKYFYAFWRQAAGLIASNKLLGSAKRLTLAVARTQYTVGQKVEIEAKVLDEMLRPSERTGLEVTLDLPGGTTQRVKLGLVDPTQGLYRGSFIVRRVGNYTAWVRPDGSDKAESVPFSVSMSTLESESRRLDVETMRRVAKETSGAWLTIDRLDTLPERIQGESQNITTEHPTEIWDSWGFLLLFAVPLTIEWWLRKRRLLT